MKMNKDRLRSALKKRRQAKAETEESVDKVLTKEVVAEATAEEPLSVEDTVPETAEDSPPPLEVTGAEFTGVETQLIEFLEMEAPLPAVQKMATNLGYEGDTEVLHQRYQASLQAEEEEEVDPAKAQLLKMLVEILHQRYQALLQAEEEEEVDPVKAQLLELMEMGTPLPALQKIAESLGFEGDLSTLSTQRNTPKPAEIIEEWDQMLLDRQFDSAIEKFVPVVENSPDNGDYLLRLAICYLRQDERDVSEAEALLRKVLTLGCEKEESFVNRMLAISLQHQKRYQESKETYEKVLSQDPSDARALVGLGSVEESISGDSRTAESFFQKAILADKTYTPTYQILAAYMSNRQEYVEALKVLRQAMRVGINYEVQLGDQYSIDQVMINLASSFLQLHQATS